MNINEVFDKSKDKKNLQNKKLIEMLDLLAEEHENTKKTLINLSYHFDKVEQTYNELLEEFESRKI